MPGILKNRASNGQELPLTHCGFLQTASRLARVHHPPEGRGILSGSDLMVDLPAMIDSYTLQPSIPSDGGTDVYKRQILTEIGG